MTQPLNPSDVVIDAAVDTVLGSMLIDALALQDGVAGLKADDFALDAHQRIFRSMERLANANRDVDLHTVMEDLQAHGELSTIGGFEYLLELGKYIPKDPQIGNYIRTIRDRAAGRRMMLQLQNAMQRLASKHDTAAEIRDSLLSNLAEETSERSKSIQDVLPRALAALNPDNLVKIRTGLPELDDMTQGGGRPKELWIVGAQPSFGKSALCRQFERAAVAQGHGVHAHTLEVADVPWLNFHMAALANVQPWKLREPELLTREDRRKMEAAACEMDRSWNYRMDDSGAVHIDQLLARSRLSVMRHKTRVITVDYLQMLCGSERNRAELMGSIARRLKAFAKEFDCWVILLSQMSRSGDVNSRPHVQQLKESGDLEAAADVILLPYRPKDARSKFTGKDELILGKQRNGATGTLNAFFNAGTMTYEHDASIREDEDNSVPVHRPHVINGTRGGR